MNWLESDEYLELRMTLATVSTTEVICYDKQLFAEGEVNIVE